MKWKVKHKSTDAERHIHKKFAFFPVQVLSQDILYWLWLEPYFSFQIANGPPEAVTFISHRYLNKYECICMCSNSIKNGEYVI